MRRDLWASEKSTWPNHQISRFVEAAGLSWHIQQAGKGPKMLLIHGTGASMHSWRELLPVLARHYTVLAADLPGHGFSDAALPARSSINGMSELLGSLLEALQFEPVYCVGHSAGAVILCRMALTRRIGPRVIISINGAFMPLAGFAGKVFPPIAKFLAANAFLQRILARRAANPQNVARVLRGTGSDVDATGLELYGRLVRDPGHLAGALRMMGNWNLSAFTRELPALATPLVLLVADNDRTVPPQQAQIVKQRLPNARVRILKAMGHLAHEEQPLQVAEEIMEICRAYPNHV